MKIHSDPARHLFSEECIGVIGFQVILNENCRRSILWIDDVTVGQKEHQLHAFIILLERVIVEGLNDDFG